MLPLKLIAAIDAKNGIAREGAIPWHLPEDIQYFREMTRYANVLMGWGTFASMDKNPLPDRHNFVLTRRHVTLKPNVEVVHNLESFLGKFREDLWVIGGESVFEETLPFATHLFITRVNKDYHCDRFFPEFEDKFGLLMHSDPRKEGDVLYRFEIWVRK